MSALFACYRELRNVAMDYMNIIYFEFDDWTTHIGDNIYPHIFLDVKLFLRTYMECTSVCANQSKKKKRNDVVVRVNRHRCVSRWPDAADRFESAWNRESEDSEWSLSLNYREERVYFSVNGDPFAEKEEENIKFLPRSSRDRHCYGWRKEKREIKRVAVCEKSMLRIFRGCMRVFVRVRIRVRVLRSFFKGN